MIPRRVHLATLLAFCLHGFLILTARYRLSFDAYTHMLFADHYRLDWWSLWDPTWYTGFSVTSYPPLVHQLMALLAHAVGVDAAFAIVMWLVLTSYPLAVYTFSRAFTGRVVAGNAALGAAVLPSIYMAAHTFGQIPTVTATLFALFGVGALGEYLRQGGRLNCALAVAIFAVVMAAHHATLLFIPWVVFGLAVHLVINHAVDGRNLIRRLAIVLPMAALAGLAVIWPFWAWGLGQSMQVPIDHLSRHNFFTDPTAILVFFLPMYGLLIFLIPFAVWSGRRRRYAGLVIAFVPLFILGLGGTTPLPALLFGAGWEWLTYDRFAFWASFLLLPFFGIAFVLARRLPPRHHLQKAGNQADSLAAGRQSLRHQRKRIGASILGLMGAIAMGIGLLPSFVPFQPAPIDMRPIVDFLTQDDRSAWRYLTFGFGDQFAYLNRLTQATTIDGSYHTARLLPELRESGLPQIDVAYWTSKGVNALDPILQKSGGHGVRWGFVNLAAYVPVLERNGWRKLTTLSNGIQVWENPAAVLPGPSPAPPDDPLASLSWGVLPLAALFVTALLALAHFRQDLARQLLFGVHRFVLGLLPVGLCFWYSVDLSANPVAQVPYIYTDGLLFLSDVLALVAILAWGIARYLLPGEEGQAEPDHADQGRRTGWSWQRVVGLLKIDRWFLALCLLASLSMLWSINWRTSLYASLQLWLVFGLFLSIQDRPDAWRPVAYGFCAALVLQILIGSWEFAAQSTAFMQPAGLVWPGSVDAATPGASVVQLASGARWLRIYGSFPHPNILGGAIIAFVGGPIALFLMAKRKLAWTMLVLFGLSAALLVLTFSRAAWIGLAVAALVLLIHRARLGRRRLWALGWAGLIGSALTALPLYSLLFTRLAGAATGVATETFSNAGRLWLFHVTMGMIRRRPLLGLGIGTYLSEYVRFVPRGYLIEPVHDLPLLVTAELGLLGALLLAGLGACILAGMLRARRVETIVFSAALLGLLATSLFDHYLWSLAPGRMLLALALGLWAGQLGREHAQGETA